MVVMGDHGMDSKGDHGGDSWAEMDAGLFFYSSAPFLTPLATYHGDLAAILDGVAALDPGRYDIFTVAEGERTVQQIDVVPTIAALMGLSIPFGNLGTIIPEFFVGEDYGAVLEATAGNAKQVFDYLMAYGEERKDVEALFGKSLLIYKKAASSAQPTTKEEQFELYLLYTSFLRSTLLTARSIWSRFDHSLMAMGIIILLFAFITSLCTISPTSKTLLAIIPGVLVGISTPIKTYFTSATETILQPHHEVIFFIALFAFTPLKIPTIPIPTRQDFVPIAMVILYVLAVASDSYTIFEDYTVLFLIQTLHSFYLVNSLTSPGALKSIHIIAMMAIARAISLVTICRPDQGPYCIPTFHLPSSSLSPLWSVVALGLTAHGIVLWKRAGWMWTGGIVMVAGYWVVESGESHGIWEVSGMRNWFVWVFWAVVAGLLVRGKSKRLDLAYLVLIMFQKPMGSLVLTLMYIYLHFRPPSGLIYLMGWLVFFGTGHQHSLNSVQYEIGFIGLEGMDWVLSPTFVVLNTFGGIILGCVANFGEECGELQKKDEKVTRKGISSTIWAFQLMVTVFFTQYFCRHSQAFRVWGPKFLFFTGISRSNQAVMSCGWCVMDFNIPYLGYTRKL